MGLGIVLALSAPAAAADAANPLPGLQDPQLDVTGGSFPPLGGSVEDAPSTQPPVTDSAPALRLRQLSDGDSPMAPLPPAIVAGPIGIALAGWMAIRANRRGGRI
jgi:hypothetical protein